MRKIAHIIKLENTYFKTEGIDGLREPHKVLCLYLDDEGTESGLLLQSPRGEIMSYDSDMYDEMTYDEEGNVYWPYVPKEVLRDEKIEGILK
jgi:hypothetical protein